MTPPADLHACAEILGDIEVRFPVEDWFVGPVRVWPIARVRLGHSMAYAAQGLQVPSSSTGISASVQRGADATRALLSPSTVRHRRTVPPAQQGERPGAVFLADGASFVTRGNSTYDRTLDPLRDDLIDAGCRALLLIPGRVPDPAPREPFRTIQPQLDLRLLRARLGRRTKAVLPSYREVIDHLQRWQMGRYMPSRDAIELAGAAMSRWAAFFEDILGAESARAGLVSEYYALRGMAFVLACRNTGIPVADVQHGLQGPLHFAYGPWHDRDQPYELLPSTFAVWSEMERADIRAWAGESRRVEVIGNRYLDRSTEADHPMDTAFQRAFDAQPAALHILVTLSDQEPASDLDELVALVRQAPPDWFWWVRRHPRCTSRDAIGAALEPVNERADVRHATSAPLYELLEKVDVHVTKASSVVLDAVRFGVPSVITGGAGAQIFERQLSGPMATAAPYGDTHQILTAIRGIAQARRTAQGGHGLRGSAIEGSRSWMFDLLAEGAPGSGTHAPVADEHDEADGPSAEA